MATSAEFPELTRIGSEIRSLRREAGLTLAELAERSHLSTRFLGDLERGRANPSVKGLLQVCGALGVGPATLFAPASQRFALIGLRGAGKTSVGAAVAERLQVPFVELDQQVEEAAGMPLAELFDIHGESAYREREADALRLTLDREGPLLLATGGSLVSHAENFATLRQRFVTCWLKATPEHHWDRVLEQGDHRPMQGHPAARQRLEELLTERHPLYSQAHHMVDTSALGLEQTIAQVADLARPVLVVGEPYTPAP